MKTLQNEIIRASAGSGKTWRLVRRYLWLLANGAEPERIAAMTFTRKAAGEFFERILQQLAEIVEYPSKAVGYVDELSGELALVLLRKMLRRMDRLRLGTIDSFFATMAQCLPFELGLTGQSVLMGEDDVNRAREDVLDELLLAVTRLHSMEALGELREAWKDAGHGSEQSRPTDTLLKWIGQLHNLFVECPDRDRWGGQDKIWPQGNDKIALSDSDMAALVARLEGALDLSVFDKRAQKKLEAFFSETLARGELDKIGKSEAEYMLKDDRLGHAQLRQGGAEWMMWKRTTLDVNSGVALADVLDVIVGRAMKVQSRRTGAQFSVMRLYETIYHRLVRSLGRLVFSDLGWLLSGRLRTTDMSAEDWRSQWEQMRMALEFRMDSRYDHWLLDEFQDTSERQWEVLAPLLEEARQDAEERRSVFLVGDLKQSIYLWRQAEPELFKHVEKAWDSGRLNLLPLNESFRSCPEVLAMVNAIFQGADADLEARFPGVGSLWKYEEHRCSGKVADLQGHAAILTAPVNDEADDTSGESAVPTLIRSIRPLSRNLTCGVLVRKNETARVLATELRRQLPGMEVICESEEAVAVDNPATLVLLSLFQLAVHPRDSLAWNHILMTPIGPVLRRKKMTSGRLSALIRESVASLGFLEVAREWAEQLKTAMAACDEFTERRFAQFFELAAEFDETGSRDVDAFLRHAREHRVREDSAHAKAIQVMTVHQSKGLEFDVVIMPELHGDALNSVSRNRMFVSRGERGQVQWILDKPEACVVQRDETLAAAQAREKARAAFEGLCRLYVGVTRA
ncbi:MAG: UvrD-helicase domain-containing protein, partial [Verrucomicrobiaceae bacterium]